MKKPAKPDAALVGKVANNPRYDKKYGIDTGMDAKEIKKAKKNTLYDMTDVYVKEIYGGRYGYRQTASGRYRERDEPDDETQLRQADAIRKSLQLKKQKASRERLKAKGKVPAKAGKKLFEVFCKEAYKNRKPFKKLGNDDLQNIYNASQHLSYEKWLWFINDAYKSAI